MAFGLVLLALVLFCLNPVCAALFWFSVPACARVANRRRPLRLLVVVLLLIGAHVLITLAVVPALARYGGRAPLPSLRSRESQLVPASPGYVLLWRNYVRTEFTSVVEDIAREISQRHDRRVTYLDGGFPFRGIPLLPHKSHSDGRKLDVAFAYRHRSTGLPSDSGPSPIGYWIYEPPPAGVTQPCDGRESWLRWDFRWLQWFGGRHELDEEATHDLILAFARRPEVRRILIEEHLRKRLRIADSKVRFQGCDAARHDDHFHVEFR